MPAALFHRRVCVAAKATADGVGDDGSNEEVWLSQDDLVLSDDDYVRVPEHDDDLVLSDDDLPEALRGGAGESERADSLVEEGAAVDLVGLGALDLVVEDGREVREDEVLRAREGRVTVSRVGSRSRVASTRTCRAGAPT